MREQRLIEYIPFPPELAGKYQNYTEGDIERLRSAGYREPMRTVDEGVGRYVAWLLAGGHAAA
jgi:ADP-L-glycero-D-manno-heptose 6-epimerase